MKLDPQIIQITANFNNIIFPLDLNELTDLLFSTGFQPARRDHILPNKLTITQGDIAIRGNTVVSVNVPSKQITVSGTIGQEIVSTLMELEPILVKAGLEMDKSCRFLEATAEFIIESKISPISSFQKFFTPMKSLDEFAKIMEDESSSLFSLRIVPKDMVIDSEDYYEVRVEPLIQQPSKKYYLYLIFRNKDASKVKSFAIQLEQKISSIMNIIEK